MNVVIDTSVLVAGVFWSAEPHRVLRAWLRGLITPVVSEEVFDEYARLLARTREREGFATDLSLWLDAIRNHSLWVEPVSLNEPVCRDVSDDKFIGAALAGGAPTLIARDPDLTTLERPFGIAILTPRAWLGTLSRAQRRRLD
jgi:putative PIN family toxin of toxin-antitoxin system